MAATKVREVKTTNNYEKFAWKWMRYSALLLIPLVWGHVILQDVVVGVHNMNLGYVAERWASIFWRGFDALLLAFAFAHGINGVRQVFNDFVHSERGRRILFIALFIFWLAVSLIGLIALLAGVGQQFPLN
jgi:succinate dehydrogenase / fumarate reductase, membrane anchor subunit